MTLTRNKTIECEVLKHTQIFSALDERMVKNYNIENNSCTIQIAILEDTCKSWIRNDNCVTPFSKNMREIAKIYCKKYFHLITPS